MSPTFWSLLHEYGAASFAKQLRLSDLLGESDDWDLDLDTGILDFGGRLQFPVQVLGTESEQSGTWLWSWANASIANPAVTAQAQQLQAYGAQHAVPEFTERQVPVDSVNGHTLCLVAAGLCGADAYYRGPYEGGAAYMLLSGPQLRAAEDRSTPRFLNAFTQFIQAFSCHHHTAFSAYARQLGLRCTGDAGVLESMSPSGDPVQARFDAEGRLTALESRLSPRG